MQGRNLSDSSNEPDVWCEACGGNDYWVILADMLHEYSRGDLPATWRYSLVRCAGCGMAFIAPEPSWPLLETFYPAVYGCYSPGVLNNPNKEARSTKYEIAKWRFANYQQRTLLGSIQMALGFLVEVLTGRTVTYTLGIPLQLAREARILDLGFGSGDWLLGMRHIGYSNLHGYDIRANDVNIGRLKSVGIDVITGDFVRNHYPDSHFDLVRLEHVFEHLLGPKDVLAKVYRLLKPGGVLVMNFPGSEGLSFRISPQHCAYRDSPRHLALHTKQSAERMVRAAGFNDISCRGFGVAVDLEATVRNILIDRKFTAHLRFGAVVAPLYRIIAVALGKGDFIMIKAVK